jgi:hypothetical protein
MYVGLLVKCPLWLQILINFGFSQQIFKKFSNTNLPKNPSSGSRSCSMRAGRQANMTKLILVFAQFCERAKQTGQFTALIGAKQ